MNLVYLNPALLVERLCPRSVYLCLSPYLYPLPCLCLSPPLSQVLGLLWVWLLAWLQVWALVWVLVFTRFDGKGLVFCSRRPRPCSFRPWRPWSRGRPWPRPVPGWGLPPG